MQLWRKSAAVALIFLSLLSASAGDEVARRILVLGDSLTAGYGLGKDLAFTAALQDRIDRAGLPYQVINAGVSGDTSAGGLRRLAWVLRQPIDVLVLALGANDGLRGVPVEETRRNLQAIIDQTRRKYPDAAVVIAGMKLPPNLGARFASRFESLYEELAEDNQAELIPFLLEGVAGEPDLNLPDGIHPTEAGHRIVADNVWKRLEPLLRARIQTGE